MRRPLTFLIMAMTIACTHTGRRHTEVLPRNKVPTSKPSAPADLPLHLEFARSRFHPHCLNFDNNKLSYVLYFGTTSRRGPLVITGDRATLGVADLPAQTTELKILIYDNMVQTLSSQSTLTLKAGIQPDVEFTSQRESCEAGTVEGSTPPASDADAEIVIQVELPTGS